MYIRWVGKSVDFEMLLSEIKTFFEKRSLIVEEQAKHGEWCLTAKIQGFSKKIRITLWGTPEDFVVEGIFVEGQPLHGFTSMFGGGIFLLQELKLRERLVELEKEFSSYLENVVIRLTNSSKRRNSI